MLFLALTPAEGKDVLALFDIEHPMKMIFGQCGMCSTKKEGWRQHDSLEFLIDDEIPESLIRLSKNSMILAKLNTGNGLGVAQVLEVLQVRTII